MWEEYATNAEPPVYLDRLAQERCDRVLHHRRICADSLDRKVTYLKNDIESVVHYVKSLMDSANPPLTEEELKAVADAKLALQEAFGAVLAIDLARNEYAKMLANVERLQAAE